MNAYDLYDQLGRDFDIGDVKDEWSFVEFNEFVYPDFKDRYIGLMLDNTDTIEKVYTAVFPDRETIDNLLARNEENILFFCHHAMGYDPELKKLPFYNMSIPHLQALKDRRISLYVSHAPLDKNGSYTTSMTLAKALQLEIVSEFCEYIGIKVGVIGHTQCKTITEFADCVRKTVGHEIKVHVYGDETICDGKVAVAAGGGVFDFILREVADLGCNTYLTGITRSNPEFEPTVNFHKIAQDNKINVIGATHYSTEKYACIAMLDYFKKRGLNTG